MEKGGSSKCKSLSADIDEPTPHLNRATSAAPSNNTASASTGVAGETEKTQTLEGLVLLHKAVEEAAAATAAAVVVAKRVAEAKKIREEEATVAAAESEKAVKEVCYFGVFNFAPLDAEIQK